MQAEERKNQEAQEPSLQDHKVRTSDEIHDLERATQTHRDRDCQKTEMKLPINCQFFLFRKDAEGFKRYLIPAHASRCEVKQNESGYWLNVWWHCGVIAPLTTQETAQALGEIPC